MQYWIRYNGMISLPGNHSPHTGFSSLLLHEARKGNYMYFKKAGASLQIRGELKKNHVGCAKEQGPIMCLTRAIRTWDL